MAQQNPQRMDAQLVIGGRYHDMDFARLELLKLLAEHQQIRVRVSADYRDAEDLGDCRFLITYTCDLAPSEAEQGALSRWVESGGRWLALHGTNALLEFTEAGVAAPRGFPLLARTVGSQFIAHPPIQPYAVELADPGHPLVRGIEPFETDDELYLCEYHEREALHPLLHTHFAGMAPGFVEEDWRGATAPHLVMYLRPLGAGAVLYNTLGHCRGHYDMRPAMDYYPQIERCSWEKPQFYELLRRGIRWCMGELD